MKTLKEVVEECGFPVYAVLDNEAEAIFHYVDDRNPKQYWSEDCIMPWNIKYTYDIKSWATSACPIKFYQALADFQASNDDGSNRPKCTCDFFEVLLKYGCRCGGI